MPVSEETYRQLAVEDPEGHWELHCGRLRMKPDMSAAHNRVATRLFRQLDRQIDESQYDLRLNMGRVRLSSQQYYIPDVAVIPVELVRPQLAQPSLEAYDAPLPLVVEVWSPSTGEYDVETKLREYQRRGDLEIWRVHPYERTLTAWRRQSVGSYSEAVYRVGTVAPAALPGVTIDVESLFR